MRGKSNLDRAHAKTRGRHAACRWCSKLALPKARPLFLPPGHLVSFLLFHSLIINLQKNDRVSDMLSLSSVP